MIVLLSPGANGPARANEEALAAALGRLGYEHEVRRAQPGRLTRPRRLWVLGALDVARRARRELERALDQGTPEAVIAVDPTSALLLPWRRLQRLAIPVAVRIDSPAAAQFPGALHAGHRRLERRALRRAALALTMGPRSTEAVRPLAHRVAEVPFGIEAPPPAPPSVGVSVLAHAGQPRHKGLDTIARAWEQLGATRGNAVMTVAGIDAGAGNAFLRLHGISEPEAWRWAGALPRERYESLLAGAAAFVSASRLEGHGIAQLEALAAGVPLVTLPADGAYEAEPLARELAPELYVPREDPAELAGAISRALALSPDDRADYAARAAALLAPFRPERVDPALAAALDSLGVERPH